MSKHYWPEAQRKATAVRGQAASVETTFTRGSSTPCSLVRDPDMASWPGMDLRGKDTAVGNHLVAVPISWVYVLLQTDWGYTNSKALAA
jgi:hypothetical protein